VTQLNEEGVAEQITTPSVHDLQIYGIVVTIILVFVVFGGVKMINKVAPAFLIPVIFSLLCIFLGIFLARRDNESTLSFRSPSPYSLQNQKTNFFIFIIMI